MAMALIAQVHLYKRLQEITSVSREIETGLLRLKDKRPAVSVFVCKPGRVPVVLL